MEFLTFFTDKTAKKLPLNKPGAHGVMQSKRPQAGKPHTAKIFPYEHLITFPQPNLYAHFNSQIRALSTRGYRRFSVIHKQGDWFFCPF